MNAPRTWVNLDMVKGAPYKRGRGRHPRLWPICTIRLRIDFCKGYNGKRVEGIVFMGRAPFQPFQREPITLSLH